MEYDSTAGEIKLEKELNEIDKFILEFARLLDDYVVVSGYVSILFGRSRATEDVDLLIPYLEKNHFIELFRKIEDADFECLNTSEPEKAFDLLQSHAIRFAKKGRPIPNIEFKTIKTDIDKYSFDNKIRVMLQGKSLYISPLEMQIAYKLFLVGEINLDEISSNKDFEDAKHLYELFKDKLNKDEILYSISILDVKEKWEFLKNA